MKKNFLLKLIAVSLVLMNLLSIATPALTVFAPGKHSDGIKTENKELNYVSLGDSMSNGFVLPGYEKSGYLEVARDAYPARFSAWLAGYEGNIVNGQTKYEGNKGTVNLTQLATSGMRTEDLLYILDIGREDGQKADHYTYDTLIDSGRLYGNYPEVYKTAITEADIISIALGNSNMGVYLTDMVGQAFEQEELNDDISYATMENAVKLIGADEELSVLAMDMYRKTLDEIAEYLPRETADRVAGMVIYVIASYLVSYGKTLDRIAELNPDAEIIIIGLFNSLSNIKADVVYGGETYEINFESILRTFFDPINAYLMEIASSKKETEEYKDISFYYAEAYEMQTLSATFGNEYAKEDAEWLLSRFVPDITGTFFPLLGEKLGLTDIAYKEVYNYYFENDTFLAEIGNLDDDAKASKIYSIEVYKALERVICEALTVVPRFDLDAMGIKFDGNTDFKAIVSEYAESFFGSLNAGMSAEDLATLMKADETIVSVLSLYGRIALANGIVSNPSADDHKMIFEVISESYLKGKSSEQALKDKFKQWFAEGIVTNYYKDDNSRYLAIGSKGAVGESAHYSALLAADLELEYGFLDKANLRISDLLALLDEEYENDEYGNELMSVYDIEKMRAEYIEAIQESDLITLDFGFNDFRDFITNQLLGYFSETYNEKLVAVNKLADRFNLPVPDLTGHKQYEMDWTRFEDIVSEEEVEEILAKVRETAIENGIPESYVIAPFAADSDLPIDLPSISLLEKVEFELYPVDMVVYVAECYLYAAMNHMYNYTFVIERIREINPDAEIMVIGGINAFEGMDMSMGDTDLSTVGQMFVMLRDGCLLGYAFATKGVSYVYVGEAENELLAQKEAPAITDVIYFDFAAGDFFFVPAAFNASADGNKYIYEQIRDAIVICCHHEYDSDCDEICNKCEEKRIVDTHVYDNGCDTICNVCGAERVPEKHTYDNACDAICNLCGAERVPEKHTYDNACDAICNVCGAKRTPEEHVYDNGCDRICNVCEAERTVGEHVYDNACDTLCNECEATRTVGEHVYDNACDKTCNICGAERTVDAHKYDNACDKTCNVCGEERTPEAHSFDKWEILEVDQNLIKKHACRECGYEESEILSTLAPTTNVDTKPADTIAEEKGCGGTIAVAGIALIVTLGTCAVFVEKKRK